MTRPRVSAQTNRDDRGFSLVELSVAMAVLVVVLALAFQQLAAAMTQTAQIDKAAATNTAARLVIDSMVAELRQASAEDPNLTAIETATATDLVFYSPDRSHPRRIRKISYHLDTASGDLFRSEDLSSNNDMAPWIFSADVVPARLILSGLTNMDVFGYVDRAGGAVTALGDIASVTINLEMLSAFTGTPERIVRTGISIRSER